MKQKYSTNSKEVRERGKGEQTTGGTNRKQAARWPIKTELSGIPPVAWLFSNFLPQTIILITQGCHQSLPHVIWKACCLQTCNHYILALVGSRDPGLCVGHAESCLLIALFPSSFDPFLCYHTQHHLVGEDSQPLCLQMFKVHGPNSQQMYFCTFVCYPGIQENCFPSCKKSVAADAKNVLSLSSPFFLICIFSATLHFWEDFT